MTMAKKTSKKMTPKKWVKKKIPADAMKKSLEKYFDIYLAKGYSKRGLSHFLKEEGYPKEIIDEVSAEHAQKTKAHKRSMLMTVLFMLVVLIVVLVPVYVFLSTAPKIAPGVADCGFDKTCFLDFANDCIPAVMHQDEDGSLVRYETAGCSLIVSFERFAKNEPEEVINLLALKTMTCPYERDNFDISWTDSFIEPTEFCEGNMKNSLFALRIAQLALTG